MTKRTETHDITDALIAAAQKAAGGVNKALRVSVAGGDRPIWVNRVPVNRDGRWGVLLHDKQFRPFQTAIVDEGERTRYFFMT